MGPDKISKTRQYPNNNKTFQTSRTFTMPRTRRMRRNAKKGSVDEPQALHDDPVEQSDQTPQVSRDSEPCVPTESPEREVKMETDEPAASEFASPPVDKQESPPAKPSKVRTGVIFWSNGMFANSFVTLQWVTRLRRRSTKRSRTSIASHPINVTTWSKSVTIFIGCTLFWEIRCALGFASRQFVLKNVFL